MGVITHIKVKEFDAHLWLKFYQEYPTRKWQELDRNWILNMHPKEGCIYTVIFLTITLLLPVIESFLLPLLENIYYETFLPMAARMILKDILKLVSHESWAVSIGAWYLVQGRVMEALGMPEVGPLLAVCLELRGSWRIHEEGSRMLRDSR